MTERSVITNTVSSTAAVRSVSALGLIWILVVAGKIFGVPSLAAWSWWIVISFPLWVGLLFIAAFAALAGIGFGIYFGALWIYSRFASARLRRRLENTAK